MEKFLAPNLKIKLLTLVLVASFFLGQACLAANANLGNAFGSSGVLKNVATEAGFNTTVTDDNKAPLVAIIQTIINAVLSVMGVFFLILMVYAGYNWMTARGDEQKVTRAKEIIVQSVIGIIIVFAAYAISYFVISRLEKGTLKQTNLGKTLAINRLREY